MLIIQKITNKSIYIPNPRVTILFTMWRIEYKISKRSQRNKKMWHTLKREDNQKRPTTSNPDIKISKDLKAATLSMVKMTKENILVINEQTGNVSKEIKT